MSTIGCETREKSGGELIREVPNFNVPLAKLNGGSSRKNREYLPQEFHLLILFQRCSRNFRDCLEV